MKQRVWASELVPGDTLVFRRNEAYTVISVLPREARTVITWLGVHNGRSELTKCLYDEDDLTPCLFVHDVRGECLAHEVVRSTMLAASVTPGAIDVRSLDGRTRLAIAVCHIPCITFITWLYCDSHLRKVIYANDYDFHDTVTLSVDPC